MILLKIKTNNRTLECIRGRLTQTRHDEPPSDAAIFTAIPKLIDLLYLSSTSKINKIWRLKAELLVTITP